MNLLGVLGVLRVIATMSFPIMKTNAYRRYGERPDVELTDESILELIPTGQPLTKAEWFSKARMAGATDQNFESHFNSIKGKNLVQVVDREGVTAYRKTSE